MPGPVAARCGFDETHLVSVMIGASRGYGPKYPDHCGIRIPCSRRDRGHHVLCKIHRLRRDAKWIEAAERYEQADLQYLSKKYVPLDQMTGLPTTEMPIMKGSIAGYLGFWWRLFGISMVLCIIAGTLVFIGVERELAAARLEAKACGGAAGAGRIGQSAGRYPGCLGRPFRFDRSCTQNPRTITLADEGQRLVMQFAKPPQRSKSRSSAFRKTKS